jgi:hypothetical protein
VRKVQCARLQKAYGTGTFQPGPPPELELIDQQIDGNNQPTTAPS